jgi:two-component system chemotaxis response regulator CheY
MRQALVVDDSRTTRRILSHLLAELSFEVREAADGRQALEALRALGAPAVVLVDWNMPEMDGLSFVRALREEPSCRGVFVMMVTTEVALTRVSEALRAGANEYLMKPFTRDMVLQKLALAGIGRDAT